GAVLARVEDLLGLEVARVERELRFLEDRGRAGGHVVAVDRAGLGEARVGVEGLRVLPLAGEAAGAADARKRDLAGGLAVEVEERDDLRALLLEVAIEDEVVRPGSLRDGDDQPASVVADRAAEEPLLLVGALVDQRVLGLIVAELVEVELLEVVRLLELLPVL